MALKDTWINRKDGDDISPEDINAVAKSAIDSEEAIANLEHDKADKAAVFKDVDLTKLKITPTTEYKVDIAENIIKPSDNNYGIQGIIEISGYCEIDVENIGTDGVSIKINGEWYEAYDETKVSFKGVVAEPIKFIVDNFAIAKFTKFVTVTDYELHNKVSNAETQIKNVDDRTKNISGSEGIDSLRQAPKTEEWTPSNVKIIDFFNANKEKFNAYFDENGNVVIKVGAFGDWSTALSGYGHAGAQHSVINNRRVIILPEAVGSHGEGNELLIAAKYVHGEGSYNLVGEKAEMSHIEGYGNVTFAPISHVGGQYNTVEETANNADVSGVNHVVSGQVAFVRGIGHTASGRAISVLGWKNRGSGNFQTIIGKKNVDDPTKAFIVGGGNENQTDDVARKNIYTLDWSGNGYFAGDVTFTYKGTTYKASDLLSRLEALEKKLGG